jgi:hypothetical protein
MISDAWRRGDRRAVRQLRTRRRGVPRGNPRDPGYRMLRYIRYADLWIMPTGLLGGLRGGQSVDPESA